MTRYYNRQEQKPMRQRLRNGATKAERLLWWRLRHSQLDGFKFRRQYGVGSYVVDVFCPEAKLAVEVDGESHFDPESRVRDERRGEFLKSFGIKIMRFTNPQVYDQLDWVIEEIWHVAKERKAMFLAAGAQAPLLTKEGVGGGRRVKGNARGKMTPLCPPLVTGEAVDMLQSHLVDELGTDPPVSPLVKGGGL